jgi:hypothetical protein
MGNEWNRIFFILLNDDGSTVSFRNADLKQKYGMTENVQNTSVRPFLTSKSLDKSVRLACFRGRQIFPETQLPRISAYTYDTRNTYGDQVYTFDVLTIRS